MMGETFPVSPRVGRKRGRPLALSIETFGLSKLNSSWLPPLSRGFSRRAVFVSVRGHRWYHRLPVSVLSWIPISWLSQLDLVRLNACVRRFRPSWGKEFRLQLQQPQPRPNSQWEIDKWCSRIPLMCAIYVLKYSLATCPLQRRRLLDLCTRGQKTKRSFRRDSAILAKLLISWPREEGFLRDVTGRSWADLRIVSSRWSRAAVPKRKSSNGAILVSSPNDTRFNT